MPRHQFFESFSTDATQQEILKIQQSFLVLLQKELCQHLPPYKRKLLETHAIPKNCQYIFPWLKKMPFKYITAETTDIHRLFPTEVSKVIGLFSSVHFPPIQKLHPWLFSFNTHYCCLFFSNHAVVWGLQEEKQKKKGMNRNMIFNMQADLVKWNKMENKEKGTSGPY